METTFMQQNLIKEDGLVQGVAVLISKKDVKHHKTQTPLFLI